MTTARDGSPRRRHTGNLSSDRLGALARAALAVAGPDAVLWAPRQAAQRWAWEPITSPDDLDPRTWRRMVNTRISPKGILLPQTQEVFSWQGRTPKIALDVPPPPQPAVILGLRPCDAVAFDRLDEALLVGEWPDVAYARARSRAVLVTFACESMSPECMCEAAGLSPTTPSGDLLVLPAGESLLLEALTAKGEAVLAELEGREPMPEAGSLVDARREELAGAAGHHAPGLAAGQDWTRLPPADPETVLAMFGMPGWEELARPCLSCGLCAFVCPTCHCFALTDEPRGDTGRRVRTWDSCGLTDFMRAAGGHDPRPAKAQRMRQRFLHKLVYHRAAHGSLMCTGCGRCAAGCPAGLHIATAAKMLLAAAEQVAQDALSGCAAPGRPQEDPQ